MLFLSALVSLTLLAALAIFQLLLAFGLPYGKFAWGGKNKILPKKLRIASLISITIYILISFFIVTKAGFLEIIQSDIVLEAGLWILFVYFMSGIVLNGMSRSSYERIAMTPACIVLATCFFVMASVSP